MDKWDVKPEGKMPAKAWQEIPNNCTVQDLLNWCRRMGIKPKDVRLSSKSSAFIETVWKEFKSFKKITDLRVQNETARID